MIPWLQFLPPADAPPAVPVEALGIALRLGGAAVLGGVVAALFRYSRNPEERQKGFAQTLVLLPPLIGMVTLAVGNNIAAAFTLVGTLAIVRFRTVVRDTRDTVYVIFSVGVGMAMGALNWMVALCGTAVIAIVIVVLRRLEVATSVDRGVTGALRLVVSPPDADAAVYEEVVRRYAKSWSVVRTSVDRVAGELELRLSLGDTDPARSPELVAALLQLPEVSRAQYTAGDET